MIGKHFSGCRNRVHSTKSVNGFHLMSPLVRY
jgi:hypothetical protein